MTWGMHGRGGHPDDIHGDNMVCAFWITDPAAEIKVRLDSVTAGNDDIWVCRLTTPSSGIYLLIEQWIVFIPFKPRGYEIGTY